MPIARHARLGLLAAALLSAACSPDGALGPAPAPADAPAASPQGALADQPWSTKVGYIRANGVDYPMTVRTRSWSPYPGFTGVPMSVEYEVTSPLGDAMRCGYTGFFTNNFRRIPCAGIIQEVVPDFVSYVIQDLGDIVLEIYGSADGSYNHSGARALRGYGYGPFALQGVAQRVAPAKAKGKDADKKAAKAARRAYEADCGTAAHTGCLDYRVFSPGNLTSFHAPYAVTVDWGDGTPADRTSASTFSTPAVTETKTARHAYAAPGTYTVRIVARSGLDTGAAGRATRTTTLTLVVH